MLPFSRTRVRFSYYSIWINMLEHTSRRILVVFSFSIRKPSALCSWSSHCEADEYYSHMSAHSWFKYINKSSVASCCSLLRSCDIINSSATPLPTEWTLIDGWTNANISFLLSMNIMGSISESMVPLIWASSNNSLLYFHWLHGSFKRSRWMEISANVN